MNQVRVTIFQTINPARYLIRGKGEKCTYNVPATRVLT